MFYKIKSVKAMENYILQITFENKTIKYYDVKNLFEKWSMFKKLRDNEELFLNVKVDVGGYGVSWDEGLDILCNELWENGIYEIK